MLDSLDYIHGHIEESISVLWKRISYFTRMDTWRAVQKVLSHKMNVVDKGKTLKVCSIIAFLT